jgi:hypothetical protein
MKRWILCLCILALGAAAADAAPSRASSRIRAYKGLMEVEVAGGTGHAVLDSLAGEAARDGYTQVSRDDEKLRMRWERTATAEEVAPAGWAVEGTERRRLQFEVVAGKNGGLKVVAVTTLVSNPNALDEKEKDVGKVQPFRDELKVMLDRVSAAFPTK